MSTHHEHKHTRGKKTKTAPKKPAEAAPEEVDPLDQALKDTFPASDPISFTEPAQRDDPTPHPESEEDQEPPGPPSP